MANNFMQISHNDHYYVINDKKFNIRKFINKNRLNYYILGEIVQEKIL